MAERKLSLCLTLLGGQAQLSNIRVVSGPALAPAVLSKAPAAKDGARPRANGIVKHPLRCGKIAMESLLVSDPQRFLEHVLRDLPAERWDGLGTLDDIVLFEILRYGIRNDAGMIPDLKQVFMRGPDPA